MTFKDFAEKIQEVKDSGEPAIAIYNGEADCMQTFDLSKASIEKDSKGFPYLLLPVPKKS